LLALESKPLRSQTTIFSVLITLETIRQLIQFVRAPRSFEASSKFNLIRRLEFERAYIQTCDSWQSKRLIDNKHTKISLPLWAYQGSESLGKNWSRMAEGGVGFSLPGTQESPEDQIPPAVPGTVLNMPVGAHQQAMAPGQPRPFGIMPQQNAFVGGM